MYLNFPFDCLSNLFSESLGRCLYLDDALQLSQLDEFAYQEMIAFIPLNAHPNPKRVLVIGGGDGGVVRELLKHPLVEEVVLCEIDEAVIRVSRQYLSFMSESFNNPKVKVEIEDGQHYVKKHKNEFDVIITDSSDPKGPAEVLFEKNYYQSLYECLKSGGIVCSQAETIWFHLPFIKTLYSMAQSIFQSVAYASVMVATYPAGQIGFLLASKDQVVDFSSPIYCFSEAQLESMKLRYYSPNIHRHAFTLPYFAEKVSINLP